MNWRLRVWGALQETNRTLAKFGALGSGQTPPQDLREWHDRVGKGVVHGRMRIHVERKLAGQAWRIMPRTIDDLPNLMR